MNLEMRLRSSLQRMLQVLQNGAAPEPVNAALIVLEHDLAAWKQERKNELAKARRK